MKLEEALKVCSPMQYLARRDWIKKDIMMCVVSPEKALKQLNLDLTPESREADDWDVYEINL